MDDHRKNRHPSYMIGVGVRTAGATTAKTMLHPLREGPSRPRIIPSGTVFEYVTNVSVDGSGTRIPVVVTLVGASGVNYQETGFINSADTNI